MVYNNDTYNDNDTDNDNNIDNNNDSENENDNDQICIPNFKSPCIFILYSFRFFSRLKRLYLPKEINNFAAQDCKECIMYIGK